MCLNVDHTVTGTFSADDSTLLSSSMVNLQDQLGLVHDYCSGSGAKLNLSKSVLLALNRSKECPLLPDVRVLGRTDTVNTLASRSDSLRSIPRSLTFLSSASMMASNIGIDGLEHFGVVCWLPRR